MGPLIFLEKSRKIFSTDDIHGFCNQKVDVRGVRMKNGGCLAAAASIKSPPPPCHVTNKIITFLNLFVLSS